MRSLLVFLGLGLFGLGYFVRAQVAAPIVAQVSVPPPVALQDEDDVKKDLSKKPIDDLSDIPQEFCNLEIDFPGAERPEITERFSFCRYAQFLLASSLENHASPPQFWRSKLSGELVETIGLIVQLTDKMYYNNPQVVCRLKLQGGKLVYAGFNASTNLYEGFNVNFFSCLQMTGYFQGRKIVLNNLPSTSPPH